MDIAVKILKIFAAVSDHWARKCGQRFWGNLDRAGNEKLIVLLHVRTLIAKPEFCSAFLRNAKSGV